MSVYQTKRSKNYWYEFVLDGVRYRGSTKKQDPALAEIAEQRIRAQAIEKLSESARRVALDRERIRKVMADSSFLSQNEAAAMIGCTVNEVKQMPLSDVFHLGPNAHYPNASVAAYIKLRNTPLCRLRASVRRAKARIYAEEVNKGRGDGGHIR